MGEQQRITKQEIYEMLHDQNKYITMEFVEELITRTGKKTYKENVF